MKLNKVIKIREDIAWQIIDDNAIIITLSDSMMHKLNSTGSEIWKIMQEEADLSKIIDVLCKKYDVSRSICEQDVLEFVEELKNKNIIELEER